MHDKSWNSKSKLNFVQCFKQIYTCTHTQLECTLKKKKEKMFKLYPEGYPAE
jgi:histidinol phosphatase-like enzyme